MCCILDDMICILSNMNCILGNMNINDIPFSLQLSIQLQQSSEYWSDKVRDLSGQLEKSRIITSPIRPR